MIVDLDRMDIRELSILVESRLKMLLAEIAHADVRAYRAELQARYDRLKSLEARLGAAAQAEEGARGVPLL